MTRNYARHETLVANLPYAAMVALGAAVIAVAFSASAWGLVGALGYVLYGIVGALWIMVFMCPYCTYYATRNCPCGYGMISARLVPRGDHDCFAEKFRRHIPVIVPLWLIPVLAGGWMLLRADSWPLLELVAAFVVNSYLILPLVSKKHGCADCPQKADCPWMATRA